MNSTLSKERPGPLWSKRLIAIPAVALGAALSAVIAPVVLPIAALYDGVFRRRFALTRFLLFLGLVLGMETLGTFRGIGIWLHAFALRKDEGWFFKANFALQKWWASNLYWGAARIFSFTTMVEGQEAVAGPGPVIMFIRHTSVADTLLPIVLVAAPQDLHLRYVLKAELLWDPCLNLVGPRLGNCFVRRGASDPEVEIQRVASLLDGIAEREGVLIYPEGTRFSLAKQARILQRLERDGHTLLLERARSLRHVLPPRIGGPVALLHNNPGADILLCAHSGFDGVSSIKDLIGGALIGRTVQVAFWRYPFSEVPKIEAEAAQWLFEVWSRVDDWVDKHPPLEGAQN